MSCPLCISELQKISDIPWSLIFCSHFVRFRKNSNFRLTKFKNLLKSLRLPLIILATTAVKFMLLEATKVLLLTIITLREAVLHTSPSNSCRNLLWTPCYICYELTLKPIQPFVLLLCLFHFTLNWYDSFQSAITL